MFLQNFISSWDGPLKSIETRQRRKNARRLSYICCIYNGYSCLSSPPLFHGRVVFFLRSFISALFLYFSGPSLFEMKFCRNLFPGGLVRGLLGQLRTATITQVHLHVCTDYSQVTVFPALHLTGVAHC